MRNIILLIIIFTLSFSCGTVDETKKLSSYLQSFGLDIKNYRVVCFVPADGCSSCIDPALGYSKKADKNFLLILTSIYKKSIDYIIEQEKIEESKIITDSHNLAASSGLVQIVSPTFYFLKNGHVVKIVDLSKTLDKISILKEVDKFLLK